MGAGAVLRTWEVKTATAPHADARMSAGPPGDPAATGAPSAFEALFLNEYGRVVAIARRVLGAGEGASDVAQDVFLAAFARDVAARPNSSAWLFAAAAHTALNHLRAQRHRAERQERDARARAAAGAGADPARALEAAEERRAVRRLLARLPKRQAAILVLRHSGLSYGEIAQALGLRPGSVGTLLRRAEVALRKEWIRHAPERR